MRKLSGSWRRDVWDRVSFVREFREARAVAKLVSTSEKKGTGVRSRDSNPSRTFVVIGGHGLTVLTKTECGKFTLNKMKPSN